MNQLEMIYCCSTENIGPQAAVQIAPLALQLIEGVYLLLIETLIKNNEFIQRRPKALISASSIIGGPQVVKVTLGL